MVDHFFHSGYVRVDNAISLPVELSIGIVRYLYFLIYFESDQGAQDTSGFHIGGKLVEVVWIVKVFVFIEENRIALMRAVLCECLLYVESFIPGVVHDFDFGVEFLWIELALVLN
jgi:hypothetical protein